MHVSENFSAVDAIAKRHMLEANVAADCAERHFAGTVYWLRLRVEDIAKTRNGEAGLMEILPGLRQPENRRANPASEQIERDQLAYGKIAAHDQPCPEI